MGRKRKHETQEKSDIANLVSNRRRLGLIRLLTNKTGLIKFRSREAAADAAWILEQPAAIARNVKAERQDYFGQEIWVVTVDAVSAGDGQSNE